MKMIFVFQIWGFFHSNLKEFYNINNIVFASKENIYREKKFSMSKELRYN